MIGKLGEDLACSYLAAHGYTIINRNLRIRRDEIDIIAKRHVNYYCIEVKTRASLSHNLAETNFNHKKITRLRRSAQAFSHEFNIPESEIFIQGIAVNINITRKLANIRHFLDII